MGNCRKRAAVSGRMVILWRQHVGKKLLFFDPLGAYVIRQEILSHWTLHSFARSCSVAALAKLWTQDLERTCGRYKC